jgi:biotin synthase
MIALSRLYLWDVNIVSSTALEVLCPGAKEMALNAGANVIMPNFTLDKYRVDYNLYPGKNEVI